MKIVAWRDRDHGVFSFFVCNIGYSEKNNSAYINMGEVRTSKELCVTNKMKLDIDTKQWYVKLFQFIMEGYGLKSHVPLWKNRLNQCNPTRC